MEASLISFRTEKDWHNGESTSLPRLQTRIDFQAQCYILVEFLGILLTALGGLGTAVSKFHQKPVVDFILLYYLH